MAKLLSSMAELPAAAGEALEHLGAPELVEELFSAKKPVRSA